MRVVLVGADFEENLGLGMIAAAAEAAGHHVEVLPFNQARHASDLAQIIAARAPAVVGLSVQFQHRAYDFLALGRKLRAAGFRGHLTCGGQFPTMAYREVLDAEAGWGMDSVVLHDGEQTFVDLLRALGNGGAIAQVPGLAVRAEDGRAVRTAPRKLLDDLDQLPFARRYRPHARHAGIPFIPLMGSRGCWGSCTFCSITTFYRDARAHGGGKRLRHRNPESIATEMAHLCRAVGGPAVFCFHDDNFLLPRPADSLHRVQAIRAALDARGVGQVALIGKCRPDCLAADLARELRRLGVIRLYVGVENVSAGGAQHLGRQVEATEVREALAACREAGIFACYNLLLFEPEATLEDVEENVAFMREHAAHPVNFCRAEPYYGTPLQRDLAAEGQLSGSYLGFDYRIQDDRVELLFRICATAFRERNFAENGVHNRYMGLGYYATLLDHFYDDPVSTATLAVEADRLTRSIALETASFLEEAMALARGPLDREAIERETALLALRVAAADRIQHAKLDALYAALQGFPERARRKPEARPLPTPRAVDSVRRVAQGVSLGLLAASCALGNQACDHRTVPQSDARPDIIVADPPPRDAGVEGPRRRDVRPDQMNVDPLPPDGGWRDGITSDPLPPDWGVKRDFPYPDPPPPPFDFGPVPIDCLPPDAGADLTATDRAQSGAHPDRQLAARQVAPTGQYRDTTPRRAERSQDLPFYSPPTVSLRATREGEGIRVCLQGDEEAMSLRWQTEGRVMGEGPDVLWVPASEEDQLSVGVRTRGGVAVVSLRCKDVG
jgi:hypothetical protein